MPSAALSLVGFIQQPDQAVSHLSRACVPANPDPAVLTAEWQAATAQLGPATPNAGVPNMQAIPAAHQGHIQALVNAAHYQPQFQPGGPFAGATFAMVEIDPLLAFQFVVDTDRAQMHCAHLTNPPTPQELLDLCLPIPPVTEAIQAAWTPQSLILKSKSLNVRMVHAGHLSPNVAGIVWAVSAPFVHVVRFNNRCYLHNGFHRTYGARLAGATHVPCLVRDVANHAEVGIRTDGATFEAVLLESANPPTLAHFTQGRAKAVQLRQHSRVLHVSWSEYAVPEE